MSIKLKPCPLCGSDSINSRSGIDPMVSCTKCGVQIHNSYRYSTLEKVIETWNNRIESNKIKKYYMDSIKKMCEDICDDDYLIRDLARPHLTDIEIDGDSYCVPSIVDIVASIVGRLNEYRNLIESVLRVKDLWLPIDDVPVEHRIEAEALQSMYNKMIKILNKQDVLP